MKEQEETGKIAVSPCLYSHQEQKQIEVRNKSNIEGLKSKKL